MGFDEELFDSWSMSYIKVEHCFHALPLRSTRVGSSKCCIISKEIFRLCELERRVPSKHCAANEY